MDEELTSPALPYGTDGNSTTLDEKHFTLSKELTPERDVLKTKDRPKSIKAFLPWLKKPSKDGPSSGSVVEGAEADALIPAPFLSLFRLDHLIFLTEISSSSMQVFNSL